MIAIGQITKSVGLKGELKILPLTDRIQRFQELQSVWLGRDDKGGTEYDVEAIRVARDHVVLKLKGVDSRSSADALKAQYVLLHENEAEKRGGAFFIHDLVGMKVVTEEGAEVGTIEDVIRLPGGDTWVIRNGNKEILIPGVREFIRNVDVIGRKVVIHVIEGLVD